MDAGVCARGEKRGGAALREIERGARHDAEQKRRRSGQQNREAQGHGHARYGENRRALGRLCVERGQQAQVVERGDAAVDQTDDGEAEHALCRAAEKT